MLTPFDADISGVNNRILRGSQILCMKRLLACTGVKMFDFELIQLDSDLFAFEMLQR